MIIQQRPAGIREVGDDLATQINAVNAGTVKHDGDFDVINISDALLLAQYLVGLRDANLNLQ